MHNGWDFVYSCLFAGISGMIIESVGKALIREWKKK
jgi:hypothetical protein